MNMRGYSVLFFVFCLYSCSHFKNAAFKKDSESRKVYKMPPNPFPSVMEQFYSYELPVNKMKIKPESMSFDCTKRNDSELFWCGIDADLAEPDKNLPHKISMLITASIPKEDVAFYRSAVKKLASSRSPLFLLGIFPFKSEPPEKPEIIGKYYGMYNDEECYNWYGYYGDCPKTAEKVQ